MRTIKIIDLLNKIANGEEVPKRIKCNGSIFDLDEDNTYYCNDISCTSNWLSNEFRFGNKDLNDEVEILDKEDKIKKLSYQQIGSWALEQHNWVDYARAVDKQIQQIGSKINELIDEVNKLKENK